MASNLGGNSGDPPVTTTRTPEELEELKKKLKELEEEKAKWQREIKIWEGAKAGNQRLLADLTGDDEVRRAELERWLTREVLEMDVQSAENHLHDSQQEALRAEAALAATAAALLHQERLQNAMEKCRKCLVNARVLIVNHSGLPRSGKTSFQLRLNEEMINILWSRLMQEKIEQRSTGVVEDGGHVLIRSARTNMGTVRSKVRSKVWSALKGMSKEFGVINQFIYQALPSESSANDTNSTGPSTNETSPSPTTHQSASMDYGNPHQPSSTAPQPTLSTGTELVFTLANALTTGKIQYLLEDTTLLIHNDTGGHAEFLDLQAALIQGPSLNLLYSRLVDDQEKEFKVYYTNEKGVSTDQEDSTMTVEEVLFQALSGIACFSEAFSGKNCSNSSQEGVTSSVAAGGKSKAMFVGTFLDMVSEEEFKRKDKLLQDKIRNTEFFKKGIVEFASETQLMLAVDNMKGGYSEIENIRKILERVIDSFDKISIPAAWLLLSMYLREKKFRTITLQECERLGGQLGMGPEEIQEALWFLHHRIGVLLYYPEVESLKNTVICQMQVVFDSVSNLIKNTFIFGKTHLSVCEKFKEKGQFTLKELKEATSGHTDNLIPLEKLVELLQHLSILTPIQPPPSSGDDHRAPEPAYFMPCVLRSARASELATPNCSERDPAPLMVRYDCGYLPMGIFPSMITNLVSQRLPEWRIIEKGLRKNRIQFRVGEDYDIVTLISRPRFFELTVSRRERFETPTATVCAHVRQVFQSTLKTVSSRMNYDFKMGYRFGFECPIHPGKDHLCVLARENARCMECLHDPKDIQPVPLTSRHKIWFEEKISSNDESTPCIEGCVVGSSDIAFLIKQLHQCAYKWREIGMALCFQCGELENIRQSAPTATVQQLLAELLSQWSEWPTAAHSDVPTVERLCDALRSGLVGLGAQANSLQDRIAQMPSWVTTAETTPTTSPLSRPEATASASSFTPTMCASSPAQGAPTIPLFYPEGIPTTSQAVASFHPNFTCTPSTDVDGAVTKNQTPLLEPCMESHPNLSCTPPLHAVTPPSQHQATPPQSTLVSPLPQLTPSDPSRWSVEDVCSWLTSQGLHKFVEIFRENEVNGEYLLSMDHELLKDGLGMKALGDRLKILKKIKDFKK